MKSILLLPFAAVALFAQSPCDSPSSAPVPFHDHDKTGYISPKGIVIPAQFDFAAPFTLDGAIACLSEQCGLLSESGSFIGQTWSRKTRPLPESYSEGLAPAVEGDVWGYLDRSRKVVIPFRYKYAGQFHQGMARVRMGDKFFFINPTGNRVTPEFDGAFDFSEDLAAVSVGSKVGYIRRDGSFALLPIYEGASGIDFSDCLVAVRLKGKVGFMDKAGNIVIEPKYDDVYPFSDGRAPVELNAKWGYIDKNGSVIVPIQYDIGHIFSEGLASVETGGKWGYIDREGHFSIPLGFDSAMPFCGGVATVETFQRIGETNKGCRAELYKGKHGVIGHGGNYVWRDAQDQTWASPFCF
jgi:hypothetical protein